MDAVDKSDWVTDRPYMAGRTQRYACWPTIHKQTVGEHTWGVMLIYTQIFGSPRPEVWEYILLHDAAELIVGDPPFPVKRDNPALKAAYDVIEPAALARMGLAMPAIHPEERVKVKICDLMEMFLFGQVEREMGNLLALPIIQRTSDAALDLASGLDRDTYVRVRDWCRKQRHRHKSVPGIASGAIEVEFD